MGRIFTPAALLWAVIAVGPLSSAQQPPILSQLAWFDRAGEQLGVVGPLANHGNVELSPDGTRIAVAIAESGTGPRNIWIYEGNGQRTQFTSDPADENWLIWAANGERVIFNAFSGRTLSLIETSATPGSAKTPFLEDATGKWPVSWSPDGQTVLVVTSSAGTGNDVWSVPMQGRRRPTPFAVTTESENWATFSPDGRWVAFSSTEAEGRAEVYVAPFPPDGRKTRISREGGTQARWRTSGEILYVAADRRLMAARVRATNEEVTVSAITPLFTLNHPFGAYHGFDVTPDGRRILVNSTIVGARGPAQQVQRRPILPPPILRGESSPS